MTIVAWDGKMLSVDSKRTSYTTKKSGERLKTKERLDVDKIVMFADESNPVGKHSVCFQGQPVLAVARCGSVKTTTMMLRIMKRGWNLERQLQLRFDRNKLDDFRRGSIFILTNTSAWVCRFSTTLGISVKEIGDRKFAMGSNAVIARFLMRHMNLDAMHAAAAVTLSSKKCGGTINSVRREVLSGACAMPVWQFQTDSRSNVRMLIAQYVAMEVFHEGKHPKKKKVKKTK